jgi:hypothetical protein
LEPQNACFALALIGVAACAFDMLAGGLFGLFYVELSWIFAGGIYFFAGRDVTDGGLLAALVLGVLGAIIWVVVDTSRRGSAETSFRFSDKQAYYKHIAEGNYKCGNCLWFGKPRCPRNETLINADPCASFMV